MRYLIILAFVSVTSCLSIAQYCTNVGPSSAIDSNIESLELVGDLGTLSYTGCPAVTGLEDLTGQEVYLTPGLSYSLDVQFGTCGGNYSGAGEAWIDFNQDQQFDVTESLGTWSGSIPTPMSQFNFTVPSLIPQGTTRLRVMHREGGTLPLDPCGSYAWGSVVDFTVQLQVGAGCAQYLGNLPSDPILVSGLPYVDNNSNSVCYGNQSSIYSSPDVFYQVIVSNLGVQQLNIDLCNSNFDTHLTVFDSQMNPITYNDDGANCGSNAEIILPTSGLDTLLIAVEGWDMQTGNYILTIDGSTLSIEDDFLSSIRIFPNPAKELIHIQTESFNRAELFDLNGKMVRSTAEKNIDIRTLSKGIYSLKVIQNDKIFTTKIVKQ